MASQWENISFNICNLLKWISQFPISNDNLVPVELVIDTDVKYSMYIIINIYVFCSEGIGYMKSTYHGSWRWTESIMNGSVVVKISFQKNFKCTEIYGGPEGTSLHKFWPLPEIVRG